MAHPTPGSDRTTPVATYRLQLRREFGFDAAASLLDYLAELGISHVYFSPYLQAAPGSTHGYDVVDHTRVNSELGGPEAHGRLCQALRLHHLGHVIDLVPNHMSIVSAENRAWWDVLEHGPTSAHASTFDIDWAHPEPSLHGKVVLPILGDHLCRVVEQGDVTVQRKGARVELSVYDRPLPLAPESVASLVGDVATHEGTGSDSASVQVLLQRAERDPDLARALDETFDRVNAHSEALHEVLSAQHYRLEYWRTARLKLNYRRFFDINELAAIRTESESVFRDTHALPVDWVQRGVVDGVRVDHPDGLLDPGAYFARLRAQAPHTWIVAEKILEPGEQLCPDWPIDGTTGYDFLNVVGGLFVDPSAEPAMTRIYREFTGEPEQDFHRLVRSCKRQVLDELLFSDLDRLSRMVYALCAEDRTHGDFTFQDVRAGLREVIAALPVYRTYVRRGKQVRTEDVQAIDGAIRMAQRDHPRLDSQLMLLLNRLLTGTLEGKRAADLVGLFQQVSGPAMAKGLEDTAFYRHARLVCLNEVGGDPSRFGVSVDEFHRFCEELQQKWPATLLATSTHDTKRSEDVRCRIALLSQIPGEWQAAVRRWSELSRPFRMGDWPDRLTEYLCWQTLVGAWPIDEPRLAGYLEKAVREAKLHTSWIDQDAAYENAVRGFARGVLGHAELRQQIEDFVEQISGPAQDTSLAQLLLKLTAPGIPDVYQGTELWDLSLTDPDNRRAVDFASRRRLLGELPGLSATATLQRSDEGLPKLFLLHRTLRLRHQRHDCFGRESSYRALTVSGKRRTHVVAFARADRIVTVVPRLVLGIDGKWADTSVTLPSGRFSNVLTSGELWQGEVPVAKLFADFPVALLQEMTSP
jgi:(1->4)-alpha-D-glucan 1-alpha-D-glucosylmutase